REAEETCDAKLPRRDRWWRACRWDSWVHPQIQPTPRWFVLPRRASRGASSAAQGVGVGFVVRGRGRGRQEEFALNEREQQPEGWQHDEDSDPEHDEQTLQGRARGCRGS